MRKKTARKGWKADAKHKKSLKRTKLALVVLALLLLLFFIGKAAAFVANLQQPITKDSFLSFRRYLWDRTARLNIVVKTNTISVLSYSPLEKSLVIVDLPNSLILPVAGGYGSWQLSSIYGLGQAEKDKLGAKMLKESVGQFLGVPVDGFLEVTGYESTYELIQTLKEGILAYAKLSEVKTDLTTSEMLSFVWGLSGVRFDKIEQVNLIRSGVLDNSVLADGTQIFSSDSDRIDSISSQYFVEGKITSEKASVSVINGTKTAGLAQKGGRVISNLGGNVIISANTTRPWQKSAIFLSPKAQRATSKRMAEIFASDCSSNLKCAIIICEMAKKYSTSDKCFTDELQITDSRADINIVLGEDAVR